MTSPPVLAYRCTVCDRAFIAVDVPAAGEILCACGAPLVPTGLPSGLYELCSPLPEVASAPEAAPAAEEVAPARQEHDVGYGASHGYDPTHGGPSGPGDAPAKT